MIKVHVNSGNVTIKEAEGTALILMAELCCIVKAVCTSFCEDEENSEEMTKAMILGVADALRYKEENGGGADLEDDENADF